MSALPAGYASAPFEAFAQIKAKTVLSIDDLKVLALVEAYGEQMYFVIADGVANEQAKALLRRNGQEERGHAHRLLKAIARKGGSFTLPDAADNPFFALLPTRMALDANLIAALEGGEVDGDLTYQAWAQAETDPEVRELLLQNGREETRHSERVTQVKQLLGAA